MKKLLRCAALLLALLPFWTSSSQAVIRYLTCDTYCCWGYGTASSQCNDNGFITTCGEWWQRTACP